MSDNITLYDTSNNYAAYKSLIEKEIGESGNWEEYGFLLPGAFQISPALALKKDHPGAALATFDTNEDLYDALENGDILFGIDHQPSTCKDTCQYQFLQMQLHPTTISFSIQ